MKRLLLFISCSTIIMVCISQNNMFLDMTSWSYYNYSYSDSTDYYITDYILGDSVINNLSYKILHKSVYVSSNITDKIQYKRIPLRENKGKIYCYIEKINSLDYGDENEDVLLYDFNLKEGDSIANSYYEAENQGYSKVTSIETILLYDGRTAKRINYDQRPSDIEYVGSLNGILSPLLGNVVTPSMSTKFLCCSHSDTLLFQTEEGRKRGCNGNTFTLADLHEVIVSQECGMSLIHPLYGAQISDISFNESAIITIGGKKYYNCGMFYLREDSLGIWLRDIPTDKEYPLYDYTLKEGMEYTIIRMDYDESKETYYYTTQNSSKIKVTSLSTMELPTGDVCRKWVFDNGFVVVEGIGLWEMSIFSIIDDSITLTTCGSWSFLNCCYIGDVLIYSHSTAQEYGCRLENFKLTPDAVENETSTTATAEKILENGQIFIQHNGKRYNLLGVEEE